MSNEPGARPEECGAGAPAGNVPSLRDWHPDVDVPPGLTLDDLASVAGMIGAWANEPEEDWSGIHLVAKVYRELSAAAESRRGRMRRSGRRMAVDEWRPMETALANAEVRAGKRVLLRLREPFGYSLGRLVAEPERSVTVGYWTETSQSDDVPARSWVSVEHGFSWIDTWEWFSLEPTGWMPLPEP